MSTRLRRLIPVAATFAASVVGAGIAVHAAMPAPSATGPLSECGEVVPNSVVVDGKIVHLVCTGETVAPTSTSVEPQPTTSSVQPTTTTAVPQTSAPTTVAPTTSVNPGPPTGPTFTESFSGPLDPARFTVAHWRNEEAGQLDPTLNGSNVTVTGGQLRVESGEQNYGDSAVRINQPFDFAGRTGTFNARASLDTLIGGWTRLTLTEDPYAVTSYGDDNAAGQGANRGVDLQFRVTGGCAVVLARTYANRVETDLPQQGGACVAVQNAPAIQPITVKVSNSSLQVLSGSTSIVNYTGLNLGFTRGYWYLDAHNHATQKYDHVQTRVSLWDDVSFDGPVIAPIKVATVTGIEGRTFTLPAGVTNPRLIFNAQHGQQDANPTLRYSLNGNATHQVTLTRLPGLIGVYMLSLPVDPAELIVGTNTVAFTWTGTTGLPPRVADVQLVWAP